MARRLDLTYRRDFHAGGHIELQIHVDLDQLAGEHETRIIDLVVLALTGRSIADRVAAVVNTPDGDCPAGPEPTILHEVPAAANDGGRPGPTPLRVVPDAEMPPPPFRLGPAPEGHRRIFTETMKTQALEYADQVGLAAAAEQIGLHPGQLRRWKRPAATPPLPGPAPAPQPVTAPPSPELAEILALLDHPEWVAGARQHRSAWIREDGKQWECSCKSKFRALGHLRLHMQRVVNPEAHRPAITSILTGEHPEPEAAPTGMVNGLAFGCACHSRFATAREWSQHRNSKPSGEQNRHRLVDQPRAALVDTGLPPHPPRRAEEPDVIVVELRNQRIGASR